MDVDFNDFIKDDFIQEGDHVRFFIPSGPCSLGDRRQSLEREQNERDVLDALSEYKYDARMSVEDVNAIVHVKTLKVIDYTKVQNWVGGGCGEECGKDEECCWPFAVEYSKTTPRRLRV